MSKEYFNNNKQNPLVNGRKTIAFLCGSLSSPYQEKLLLGISDAAKERDINIIAFAGSVINSTNKHAKSRAKAFQLFDPNLVDGMIIPMNSLSRFMTSEETYDFLKQYSSIPVVNIGIDLKGYTNVLADFEIGLTKLINHLVDEHGYRRIALFRGPINHKSSDTRMEIYKKQLEKKGIEFEQNLVIYGDQNKNSAKASVAEFLDDRLESCDAIISLNDNQALGIMECLQDRGISVPQDIAVTGSMGIIEGSLSQPSLTTIKEPVYDLGRMALFAMEEILNGNEQQGSIYIPTSLIKRESCGCQNHSLKKQGTYIVSQESLKLKKDNSETDMIKAVKIECLEILQENNCLYHTDVVLGLLPKYYNALVGGEYDSFIVELREIVSKVTNTIDIQAWFSIISVFENCGLEYLGATKKIDEFTEFFGKLLFIKEEAEFFTIAYNNIDTNINNYCIRQIISYTNRTFNLNIITSYALQMLKASELYISFYEDKEEVSGWANNVVAIQNKEFIEIEQENKRILSPSLIPSCVNTYQERYTFLVFTLAVRKDSLGYLVVNLGKKDGRLYENIQAIIRNAWQNELQFLELVEARERFRDIAYSTSDWLWETDQQNRFTYCSNNVLHVLGYSKEEMVGKRLFEFSISENALYDEFIVSKETLDGVEIWNRHKNGSLVCLLMSATPIIHEGLFVGYRGVFEDITEKRNQEERIKNLAYHDTLTGLPNRTLFNDRLESIIKESEMEESKFSLMFLDLDRFKYINDSMGHAAGDTLLIQVANMLKDCLSEDDFLARLGGDEFTIIISNVIEKQEVINVAERILKSFIPPIEISGKQIFVTVSIGIATYPLNGLNSKSLLKYADTAMYKAKAEGRNQYVFYNKVIEANSNKRIELEEILYSAIENNEFFVEYQPQINCVTGRINRVEALVRIMSKEHGCVSPGRFIALAEELGLISYIDQWVFKEACRQYSLWIEKGYSAMKLSINLSALQLRDKGIVNNYMKIIDEYNVDSNDIQLEITENVLIDNEERALEILKDFKKNGIKIALDDFGTGQSSLRCIKIFPIDTVKIDRMFVKDAMHNEKNIAIINGVMQMVRSLNIGIVAEGVETREGYDLIRSLGFTEIQGYYFSKPCSVSDIEVLMGEKYYFDV